MSTEIQHHVTYTLPFGPPGRLAHAVVVRRELAATVASRETAIRRIVVAIRRIVV